MGSEAINPAKPEKVANPKCYGEDVPHCATCSDWISKHPDGYWECSQCGVTTPQEKWAE
jgi:ribosomal protein S27AE